MLLLIDGDVLAYRAAFACQKQKYLVTNYEALTFDCFDDAKAAKAHATRDDSYHQTWTRTELEPEEKAVEIADIMIRDIVNRFDMEAMTFLSGVGNFRNSIATRKTYKGNRTEKPKHLDAVRQHMIENWSTKVSFMQEADDDMAIAMTANPDAVCVSIDKDLLQLPGNHYNFVTKESTVQTTRAAWMSFWQQCISGDPTDAVPGIDGMGEVKARKALEGAKSNKECWSRILSLYEKAYGDDGEKYAIECASLVYLLRTPGDKFCAP